MEKPKTKSVVSDIIDEMISLTKPKSNKDIKDELARDKINYLMNKLLMTTTTKKPILY